MEDIDVRILKLSSKLSSNPYQDPNNNQYISYLPSSEREISPVPHSAQDSPLSTPTHSLTSSNLSVTQTTSPSTSVSSRSPNYDCSKPVSKRPNAIFNLSNKANSKKSAKLSPKPVYQAAANPSSKKKPPSIFLNVRSSQTNRAMKSSSPVPTSSRALPTKLPPNVIKISGATRMISPRLTDAKSEVCHHDQCN